MVTERDPRFSGQGGAGGHLRHLVPDLPRRGAASWSGSTASTTTAGLEIVGLAYEVTGDTAIDARQLRRYRRKFGIPFPLLLAGINDTEAAGGDPAAAPRVHLVPDDGVSRAGWPGAPGPRRLLRPGDGGAARATASGVRAGGGAVAGGAAGMKRRVVLGEAIPRFAQDDFVFTLAVFASGSTRSPRYSPAIACPGTPHSSQYHPA